MIRAIVFDCFGVLVTEKWLGFKDRNFGHDRELFNQVTAISQQADAGLIGYDEAVRRVAEIANLPLTEVYDATQDNAPNEPLFNYIRQLKRHYKVGMLSNAAANWLDELFTPEQQKLFDAVSLSFEAGVAKPESQAYQNIAGRLGVGVEECVLVDDQERHCAGARQAGMKAVLYKDFQQMKTELEQLLADPKG